MNIKPLFIILKKKKTFKLTTGRICLLLAGQNVRKTGLLLSLIQNVVPVGGQKCTSMKVHYTKHEQGYRFQLIESLRLDKDIGELPSKLIINS